VGGIGFELDPKSQKPLRGRGFGPGFGTHHLRLGLDDDRLVADDVSLGDIPLDQERNQGSHPDRFEGTDSGMHVRFSGQHARCEVLDMLVFESGSIYLFDKGYIDFARLQRIAASGAFFVTRAKENLRFARQKSRPVDKTLGLRSDQLGYLALPKARENFPSPLRRIRFFDAEQKRFLVFLTNHMELPALTVAKLYKKRWEIELFFKWIKGNLRIKHYY
jgi:IS4 transposase